jgi:hypothetical protein
VNPTQMPVTTKARTSIGTAKRLPLVVRVPKKPGDKRTYDVGQDRPHGNCGPVVRGTVAASQARPMLPNAPPRPIQK